MRNLTKFLSSFFCLDKISIRSSFKSWPLIIKSSKSRRLRPLVWAKDVNPKIKINRNVRIFIAIVLFGIKLFSLEISSGKPASKSPTKVQWPDGSGLLLCPQTDQKVAGLIIVPDEWGINDFVRRELEFWAEDGVCALAVNLLNDQIPVNEKEAERIKDKMVAENTQQIIGGAYNYLIRQNTVDREKIGILGWGSGGVRALKASTAENKYQAVANVSSPIYYQASLLDHLVGSFLFIYPETSDYKKSDIEDFKKSLKKAHIEFEIRPISAEGRRYYDIGYLKDYNVKAAARTRTLLVDFFARHLTLKQVRKEPLH